MSTLLISLVGSLLATATAVGGVPTRAFYVDAARGDDARDGLRPETAWRSLAQVNRAPLAPGDRVLFRRSQSWRGQLVPRSGAAGAAITYGAYGEGGKPALLGSVAADRTEDWQAAGASLWVTVTRTNQASPLSVDVGNIIWNSEYSFEYWNRGPASQTRNIVFEHNTCADAGCGWGHDQRPDPNGRHLMFYDNRAETTNVVIRYNIFCNAADSLLRLHGRDWTAALMMDYNCWFQLRGPILLWDQQKVGAEGFAAFMHPRGLDIHSVLAEPKFLDAARHDYRLAPDSPARALAGQGTPAGALPD